MNLIENKVEYKFIIHILSGQYSKTLHVRKLRNRRLKIEKINKRKCKISIEFTKSLRIIKKHVLGGKLKIVDDAIKIGM